MICMHAPAHRKRRWCKFTAIFLSRAVHAVISWIQLGAVHPNRLRPARFTLTPGDWGQSLLPQPSATKSKRILRNVRDAVRSCDPVLFGSANDCRGTNFGE